MDGEILRLTMRNWPSGVSIVTTQDAHGTQYGMTVSSFTSVSLEPPLVLVCLSKEAHTTQVLLDSRVFGVVLVDEERTDLSVRFAGFDPNFPHETDRFQDLRTFTLLTGAPLLHDAVAVLDCRLWAVYDGSTHNIVVGEVLASQVPEAAAKPLVYYNRGYYSLENHD